MLIERVEFLGFGSIIAEQVDFASDRLNLVIEANQYGKSTMVEAIWALIFGFSSTREGQREKEDFKPWQTNAPFGGIIDLTIKNQSLRIIRDFDKDSVQVLDRSSGADITRDFVEEGREDELGYRLTGMTRDLFRNTCLVGQRHLDEHHAGGNPELRSDLKSMADSSKPGATSATATDVIRRALRNFPGSNQTAPAEEVIAELESKRNHLLIRIQEMNEDYGQVVSWLKEIADIEQQFTGQSAGSAEAEFNNLKLEKMSLEEKTVVFKDRKGARDSIEKRLLELSTMTPLADETLLNLNELWTRRESRIQDLLSFGQDVRPEHAEFERIANALEEKYPGFDQLQPEESNTISSLAISLYNLKRELEEDRRTLQETTVTRLERLGSDEVVAAPGRGLRALSEEEMEEARSYASLMVAFNEQLIDSQKKLQEAEFSRTDIEEKQKANRLANIGKGIGLGLLTIICFAVPPLISEIPQFITGGLVIVALLSLLVCFFFVGKAINFKSYMQEDLERAQREEEKILKVLQQSRGKVANLENTLAGYAAKTGLSGKEELNEYLKKATSEEELHEEQLSKENSIKTKEQQVRKLENDLAYYFRKVGRDTDQIDSQRAMDLSQDIKQYWEEAAKLEEQFSEINNTRKQMEFLEAEIKDVEEGIRPILDVASMDQAVDLDEASDQIEALVGIIREKQRLNEELSKLDYDMSGYESMVSSDAQLQVQIKQINERLEELIQLNPELADCPEPDPNNPPTAVLPWGASEGDKEELRARKEDLLVRLRTTISNRDNSYLDCVEELSTLDHELVCARRARLALELACQKLEESSSQTYEDWSEKLNDASKEIIEGLDSEVESLVFDSELNISVKLKGREEPFYPDEIKTKLSTGVKEQVHWLARMALSRFLSRQEPLPIVLDEPFSEADDERFINVMKFLLDEALHKNQIIILSCHKHRHEWLCDKLSAEERAGLAFVEKSAVDMASL